MRRRQSVSRVDKNNLIGKVSLILLIFLLIIGAFAYKTSELLRNPYRYSIILHSANKLHFISFDPAEKRVLNIEYPTELEIESRSVGTYRIGDLARIASYEKEPGDFARRKVQGFMRVPVEGYILTERELGDGVKNELLRELLVNWTVKNSNVGLADRLILGYRAANYIWEYVNKDELVRAGVIKIDDERKYDQNRLKQFLSVRVFDWTIGANKTTVAIVNGSAEDGLGRDVSDFLTNMGFDVVSVSTGEDKLLDESVIKFVSSTELEQRRTSELLVRLFDWQSVAIESREDRADIVIYLGKDSLSLF